MFCMHTAFSLELLVIIAAFLLYLKAQKHNASFIKIISVIIIILSIATALCTVYNAVRFWHARPFNPMYPQQMIDKANLPTTTRPNR